ncbi:hypothetical protein CC78DRAFT_11464 [Lojkania enalia]|uniref:Uncharacterized protein n=1 Tax=Lojkania enalia TaxID=147567 RepID=A0A9P4ND50_9PLEO|nr:hypothetical protein CC78DRAFT_11464 [Didymosphaeria enalia]
MRYSPKTPRGDQNARRTQRPPPNPQHPVHTASSWWRQSPDAPSSSSPSSAQQTPESSDSAASAPTREYEEQALKPRLGLPILNLEMQQYHEWKNTALKSFVRASKENVGRGDESEVVKAPEPCSSRHHDERRHRALLSSLTSELTHVRPGKEESSSGRAVEWQQCTKPSSSMHRDEQPMLQRRSIEDLPGYRPTERKNWRCCSGPICRAVRAAEEAKVKKKMEMGREERGVEVGSMPNIEHYVDIYKCTNRLHLGDLLELSINRVLWKIVLEKRPGRVQES